MHAGQPTMTAMPPTDHRPSSTPVHTLSTLALVFPIGHLIEQALALIDAWIVGGVSTVVCGAASAR